MKADQLNNLQVTLFLGIDDGSVGKLPIYLHQEHDSYLIMKQAFHFLGVVEHNNRVTALFLSLSKLHPLNYIRCYIVSGRLSNTFFFI